MSYIGNRVGTNNGQVQNGLLRIETAQLRPTYQAQATYQQGKHTEQRAVSTTTITSHMLVTTRTANNHTSGQEQSSLKASVSHKVTHTSLTTNLAQTNTNHHITQLTTGAKCNNTLNIALMSAKYTSHES